MSTGISTVVPAALQVRKRSGNLVTYQRSKITQVVMLCLVNDCGRALDDDTRALAAKVTDRVERLIASIGGTIAVEAIQNFVEEALFAVGEADAGRKYVLFRDERRKIREASALAGVTDEAVEAIREETRLCETRGTTDLQRFQHYDKYARFNDDFKRRETYPESTDRVMGFIQYHLRKHGMPTLEAGDYQMLRDSIINEEATPSMRLMQMAGPAATRCNVGIYNCSYSGIRDVDYFAENLYISMAGAGCGFSCESEFVEQLPRIQRRRRNSVPDVFVVPDATEGWCDSVKHLMYRLYEGYDLDIKYHEIRPEGSRLMTKGGRASGPKPLSDLHTAIRRLFRAREGKRLRDIDVHDSMCYIGQVGQLGGVRRAALISLSNLKSQLMREAKFGKYWENPLYVQRAMSNNSAVYDEKPEAHVFLAEWLSLVISKSGERGIFNRGGLARQMPQRRIDQYGDSFFDVLWGTNPCQPANATVLTRDGIRTMGELKTGDVIWTGKHWSEVTRKVYTGVKPVFRYQTTAGFFLGTENHRVVSHGEKIEAQDAETIDRCVGPITRDDASYLGLQSLPCDRDVLDGLLIGDGSVHAASDNLIYLCVGENDGDVLDRFPSHLSHRPGIRSHAYAIGEDATVTAAELPYTYLRSVPARFKHGDELKIRGFLRGLYSANGSVCGGRVILKATSFKIISDVQEMLSGLGIPSYYTPKAAKAVRFDNGTYECRESYDLNITTGKGRFATMIGFVQGYKQEKANQAALTEQPTRKHSFEIISISDEGSQPVWDITVAADEHTYWTGGMLVSNCGEVILHPDGQFCNLSIPIVRPTDTGVILERKVRLAAIFGTIQSTMTDFSYLRPRWKENCEAERLLGVDLLGALDSPLLRDSNPDRHRLLEHLKQTALSENRVWAKRLGINPSNAVTCIKPGGNSGARYGVGQSMGGWLAQHMIRNVEVGNINPMCRFLKDQGVPHEVCYRDPGTTIFSFPLKAPEGSMVVSDLVTDVSGKVVATKSRRSAMCQLEDWLAFKKHYTEHNPSVTIYVGDDEWPQVAGWVYAHWEDVGGLAFLPLDGGVYPQAPFTPLTPEQFADFTANFPKIEWEKLPRYEHGIDHTNVRKELACSGDSCIM